MLEIARQEFIHVCGQCMLWVRLCLHAVLAEVILFACRCEAVVPHVFGLSEGSHLECQEVVFTTGLPKRPARTFVQLAVDQNGVFIHKWCILWQTCRWYTEQIDHSMCPFLLRVSLSHSSGPCLQSSQDQLCMAQRYMVRLLLLHIARQEFRHVCVDCML